MVVIGIDARKRTHTAVLVDANGRQLASRTCGSTSKDHLALLRWAASQDQERTWALEDCRNMTRRLPAKRASRWTVRAGRRPNGYPDSRGLLAQWQSCGLLIHRFGVRIPGGPPNPGR